LAALSTGYHDFVAQGQAQDQSRVQGRRVWKVVVLVSTPASPLHPISANAPDHPDFTRASGRIPRLHVKAGVCSEHIFFRSCEPNSEKSVVGPAGRRWEKKRKRTHQKKAKKDFEDIHPTKEQGKSNNSVKTQYRSQFGLIG